MSRITRLPALAVLFALALSACATAPSSTKSEAADSTSAKASSDDIFSMPYLLRELGNGLVVIVVPTDYPDIVNLQIPVQTGSRNEIEPGKSGFAHFFEHMMFRGTEKYPADAYAEILKNAGADQNAFTTDDFTNYHITFTKPDLDKILELEADRFMNLQYTEKQFRTEAQAVKGEYLKNYANPIQKIFERMRAIAFTDHPYQHTTMGFFEDIEDMPNQFDYSHTFFDRWYRPEKSAVILVGDLDPEATFDLVKKHFGAWERGSYEARIPQDAPPVDSRYEHIEWEAPTQPWLTIGFRGPRFDPQGKAMPSIDLVSELYFGENTELYQQVVNRERWADQFFAYFPDRKDPGLLMLGARLTDAAHATAVRDAIADTIAKARTELVDDSRIEATKRRLRYAFTARMDNSEAIGGALAGFVQFNRDPEVVNEVYRRYRALTPTDVRAAADGYFVDAGRTTISLSNAPTLAGLTDDWSIDSRVASLRSQGVPEVKIVEKRSADAPLVDVAFLFRTGSAYEPAGKAGVAALTAGMLTDAGSKAKSLEEITQAMYPMAANFTAQVDKEMVRLAGTVHRDNLDAWYQLVRGQLLTPGWREDDLERLKTQGGNAIRTDLVGNNDEELGKEALYQFIYGPDHPYGHYNLGASDEVAALTLADLREFYAQQFTAQNLTVGLAGGYPEGFAARLRADLARLPQGTANALALGQPAPIDGHEALVIEKETPAVAVSFGFPLACRRGDPDWVALWLARSWLGEHRSTNSHLFQRIREVRGMNYGNYAYIEYFPRGMFQFHPDPNLGRQQQIFQVWIRPLRSNNDAHFATRVALFELERMISEGLSEADFEATRNYLNKFVSLLVKTQSRQLGYKLDSDYYGVDAFTDYVRAELKRLTVADVNAAIRKHLQMDDIKFVFITKDAADLRDRLISNQPSPIEYNTPKPELAEEDRRIADWPLGLDATKVRIVSADDVFK